MTTGKFTLVIRWPSGQSTICGEMTDHQHGEICRILSPDYRAQPIQGGAAVEVVAYIDDGGALYTSKLLEIMSVESDGCEPLMTVAQHQRILAATVGNAEPVAMKTHGAWDGLDDLANLPDGTKLYTHPADQVADGVVVSRELLDQIAVELEHDNDRYFLGRELRALLEPKP